MVSRFHYITQDTEGFSHAQLAEFACKGGADWVQLRIKTKPIPHPSQREGRNINKSLLQIANATKIICKKYGAKLIINDHVHIAKEVGADGVHLGKEDMSPKEARKILGNNFIIGGSSNTMDDVKWLMAHGVDYIGIGPYRFTSTKEKLNPILGLDGIKNIIRTISPSWRGTGGDIPMIAIGGIKLEDVGLLMETGIHGIAVSSGINMQEDKIGMIRKFISAINTTSPVTRNA